MPERHAAPSPAASHTPPTPTLPLQGRVAAAAAGRGPSPATITLNGRRIAYTVRRSARARRTGLRIAPATGLEVVLPARGRTPDIPALLREKADWILRTLDRFAADQPPPAAALGDGAELVYAGVAHRLIVTARPRARPAVTRDPAALTIAVVHDPGTAPLAAVLEGWYRAEARAAIAARVATWAAALGVRPARLTIRDTRSRWGSCSSTGALSFSWRLLLAPPAILDYVVIHELAHLRELNHGPRFWTLVAAHCPDFQERRAWLRQHGAALLALLR